MSRTVNPKVNKHYRVFVLVGSVYKWRSLTVTNVDSATQVDGRYQRHTPTVSNAVRASVTARKTVNAWSVY